MDLSLSLKAACVAVLVLVTAAAQGQQLYKWTDAEGKVHMSDKPPPEGTPGVSKQALPKDEVSPATRNAAQQRAAADKAKAQQLEAARNPKASQRAASASVGAQESARNETDCQKRRRLFEESASCWGGFKLANGALRPGAMEQCGPPVEDPSAQCPAR